jgi:hypothetical protein
MTKEEKLIEVVINDMVKRTVLNFKISKSTGKSVCRLSFPWRNGRTRPTVIRQTDTFNENYWKKSQVPYSFAFYINNLYGFDFNPIDADVTNLKCFYVEYRRRLFDRVMNESDVVYE